MDRNVSSSSASGGSIEAATLLSQVKQEPYSLNPSYEWTEFDMNSDEMLEKLHRFVNYNYPDNPSQSIKRNYSKEFTKWILSPNNYHQSWILGISVKDSKALAGFISAVPARIKVAGEVIEMAKILMFCVDRDRRSMGFGSLLIKEITRRIQLKNVWHAVYFSSKTLPRITPVTTCRYWTRMLNVKKVIDLELEKLGERMNRRRAIRLYDLPPATITPGFRKMETHDLFDVRTLLSDYFEQFHVAMTGFLWHDIDYWFQKNEGEEFIYSYVVESPQTKEITDFCSFSRASYTVAGNPNYTTLEYASSSCNVATKTSFPDLMKDVLISAKNEGFDMFYALDVMHNDRFLEDLKFKRAGREVHCYLHNCQLERKLRPSEVALLV